MSLIDPTTSAYAYPLLIKQLLHTPLCHAPEQEIVYRDLKRLSYRQLHERIGRLASGLAWLGVKLGDTVGVMDWDSHRYLECFFAVPMMGAVLQTVNIRLSPDQVLYTLNHASPTVLLVNADFLPMLGTIKSQLTSVRKFVLITDAAAAREDRRSFDAEYEELLAAHGPEYEFPDFDENVRATTFYTTGTTGLPKGVYFSHRQLVLHSLALLAGLAMPAQQGRFHRDDVYMPITPMFHVHAWGNPYIATLMGVKQVYPGRYTPEMLLALKQSEGASFSHCVPTILQMILNHPAAKDVDLRGWKIVIGGSALPIGLAKQALERGIDVFSGYGLSETCPALSLAQVKTRHLAAGADEEVAHRVKAGLPVPLVDLRVVDGQMRDVPHDGKTTGEVVARAPWLTRGYLWDPQASESLWAGGYLHTGDIANIDPDGYLQITDRLKDVIKTGGEWISSIELEDILSRHPGVAEVAVIGVKDEKWGERPLALIVATTGQSGAVAPAVLRDHVLGYVKRGIISKYAVPEQIIFVEALDKTSVGKLDKKLMREKYGAADAIRLWQGKAST